MWLKAESSPHKYQCVQPSHCPFAIWDTPLCKQLSADGEDEQAAPFSLILLFRSGVPKCCSEARWTIVGG